ADVIVTTLVSSGNYYINEIKDQFSLLIVDEASQATELITLIPFCYDIPKAILIGDSKQLPPTVINSEITRHNFDRSFFLRLDSNSPNSVHLLNIQYRMHPMISRLSSKCFYSNKIVNGNNVVSKKWYKEWCRQNKDFGPLVFYDVKGFTNNSNASLNNVKEVSEIIDYIKKFIQSPEFINFNTEISIISPYHDNDIIEKKEKKNIIKRFNILDNIKVNTVDSYQGQESDIVILSCVRSRTTKLGFLQDKRRLNVSITRARYSLIIFGDSETLCKDKEWEKIINEIKMMKCYRTVSIL
ncbi:AAA domain-containing protein, partial [Neocallimastix sp. 'constans']